MVTHDLNSLLNIVDDVIVIDKSKLIVQGPVKEVANYDYPWLQSYFGTWGKAKSH